MFERQMLKRELKQQEREMSGEKEVPK